MHQSIPHMDLIRVATIDYLRFEPEASVEQIKIEGQKISLNFGAH